MRKNSRGKLSGAVRDETSLRFNDKKRTSPHATSRRFRLTPMRSRCEGGEPTAFWKKPHNIILERARSYNFHLLYRGFGKSGPGFYLGPC